MDTMTAFAMGEANRGKELMVFDWDKAAQMIKDSGFKDAVAGLAGDWEWTGGYIFENKKPNMEDYTYLSSTWATPEISVDGNVCDCFKMQSEVPVWGSDTKWPQSALNILNSQKIFLSEEQLVEKIKEWVDECDSDELACLAGELLGGKCFFDYVRSLEKEDCYEFEPDENYGGAFG
jgi:hypothetical protein